MTGPPAPAGVPRLPADRVAPEYRRLRRQVFTGIFVGYAGYYLVRNTLALAIPDILEAYPQYSKAMLGTAMTGLSIAYGASKFLMGSVSDRSNPRYFLPLGLLLSAAIIFASGTMKWIYSSLVLVVALQTLNGWVQDMGWPPCGKTMVHWWYAAIPGTIACGWISDRCFKGRRAPANILFMALTLVAVVVYWLNANGPLWIDYAALVAIGFLIYGPIMIIGLHALDLVPKKAAGTAAGFTGFFGYAFGSAIAGTGIGWIADRWGWNGVFVTMVACCVLTMAFTALTLGHATTSERRRQ